MNQGDKYPSGTQAVRERSLSPEGIDATRAYLNVVEVAFSSAVRYAGTQQPQPVAHALDVLLADNGVVENYRNDQEAA